MAKTFEFRRWTGRRLRNFNSKTWREVIRAKLSLDIACNRLEDFKHPTKPLFSDFKIRPRIDQLASYDDDLCIPEALPRCAPDTREDAEFDGEIPKFESDFFVVIRGGSAAQSNKDCILDGKYEEV